MLMKNILNFDVYPNSGIAGDDETFSTIPFEVERIGCSRHAGRDFSATEKILEEERSKGYQIHGAAGVCLKGRYLLTNENTIEVQGPHTSGEVEFVAFNNGSSIYISVGSDHNDRSLDVIDTPMLGRISDPAKTKQMVPSVVSKSAWFYDDIKAHWDEIVLKSFVTVSGKRIDYQEFRQSELLDLEYYLSNTTFFEQEGSVLLGGSGDVLESVPSNIWQGQSTLVDVVFPDGFGVEMVDPVLNRSLSHYYTVISLEESDSLSL